MTNAIRWNRAALYYERSKLPNFEKRRRRQRVPRPDPTLQAFIESNEGKAALSLLCASGRSIILGESEACMCMTTSVVLTADGLIESQQDVGLAAALTGTAEPPRVRSVTAREAVAFLADHNQNWAGEDSLLDYIRRELDSIADEAP